MKPLFSTSKRTSGAVKTAGLLLAIALGLAGCGSNQASSSNTSKEKTLDKVTFALDWTPNTNHTGVFVALNKGWYKDAGIDLKIMGYSKAGVPNTLENDGAQFGISYAKELAAADAAGSHLKMVFDLQQKTSVGVGVRKDSKFARPRDLDGSIFASAGGTGTAAKQMIINDGGKGDFKTIKMDTGAYQAVQDGRADWAQVFATWEGVEWELRGKPFRIFYPGDYGVPTSPCDIGVATTYKLIKENPDLVKRFVQATKKGYDYALNHPNESAKILIKENPDAKLSPELVTKSQDLLSGQFWKDSRGETGLADLKRWDNYIGYLVKIKALTNQDGKPLTQTPALDTLVTNEFVQ